MEGSGWRLSFAFKRSGAVARNAGEGLQNHKLKAQGFLIRLNKRLAAKKRPERAAL
jgi:hypothetical protein